MLFFSLEVWKNARIALLNFLIGHNPGVCVVYVFSVWTWAGGQKSMSGVFLTAFHLVC